MPEIIAIDQDNVGLFFISPGEAMIFPFRKCLDHDGMSFRAGQGEWFLET
jgi:hypothetical protein